MNQSQVVVPLHNRNANRRGALKRPGLKIAAAMCSVVLLLLIAAQWWQGHPDAARMTEVSAGGDVQASPPSFDYFPAQYRSEAHGISPEPHIQAF